MSRSLNRTGFGNNRGALNKPFFIGTIAPSNPVLYHIWLDISTSPALLKYWNGNAWTR